MKRSELKEGYFYSNTRITNTRLVLTIDEVNKNVVTTLYNKGKRITQFTDTFPIEYIVRNYEPCIEMNIKKDIKEFLDDET